jgi:hypothetical protein
MPKKPRILASRTLDLLPLDDGPAQKVKVIVYCPLGLPNRKGFSCSYRIEGLGNDVTKEARGADQVQAVIHTLAKVGLDLYKCEESKAGRLRWCGDSNLGFPVFEAMKEFVPGPIDTLVL